MEMQNNKVYQETTMPLNPATLATKITIKPATPTKTTIKTFGVNTKTTNPTTRNSGKRRRSGEYYYNRNDKSDLGENFIAPDGGWAWLVCIAAGISNLSIYPCLQQFGFIFRERLLELGLTSSQITTIINTNPAVSACTGLLNGPMFRRFTFRQVAMAGSLCIFFGIVLTAFCETFSGYMFAYALLFGFGMGINVSASSLAINTYFKNNRRRASGFSWTITGLGPIFLPHVVTLMLAVYGIQGTVLVFAALSLHSFVCALIYQPVYYHTTDTSTDAGMDGNLMLSTVAAGGAVATPVEAEYLCKYCTMQHKREKGIFASQYLYQDDDAVQPSFEIMEPGTPMLSRANDGWYGSRISLASGKTRFRTISSSKDLELTNRLNKVISEEEMRLNGEFYKPNNFKRERDELQHRNSLRRHLSNAGETPCRLYCTCAEEKALLESARLENVSYDKHNNNAKYNYNTADVPDVEDDNDDDDQALTAVQQEQQKQQMSFLQKVVTFFDLDLLRDFTFVNLVAGLTMINFGELNFSILTPFILIDFGFDTSQITVAMSILGGMDIFMRLIVPFLAEKLAWDNRVFFLIGVVGIAIGRTIVACTRSYSVILASFVWIGLCKGVRTIFWPLIIPGYVPLNRLPGASGLQLLITGLFTLAAGPFVGLMRDTYNYSVTLHCLNIMTFATAISWTLEAWLRRRRRKAPNIQK